MTQVATFNLPWRIAFLPDGRMLVTEKVGPVWLVTQQGEKTPVDNVPAVCTRARAACWASSCRRITRPTTTSTSRMRSRATAGSSLALARARLVDRRGHGEPGRIAGAVAPDAEGQGRTVRRADRLFARRPVSVPHGRRSAAHDARAGSGPGARQDPAPDARRQARARQPDGRKDRRGHAFR